MTKPLAAPMPWTMKLPRYTFRIVLPVIYLVLGLLPVVGLILTIAEEPNPFGFLLFVSTPGFYVVDAFSWVVALPKANMFIEMLLAILVNMGMYFAIGYVVDFAINADVHETRVAPNQWRHRITQWTRTTDSIEFLL